VYNNLFAAAQTTSEPIILMRVYVFCYLTIKNKYNITRQLIHLSVLVGTFTTVNERNHISSTHVSNISDVYLTAALASIQQTDEDVLIDNRPGKYLLP
jgi:hypothetical protein